MFQITQDHTLVQSLLDDGKITAEEVASHPQRFMLLRALNGGNSEPDPSSCARRGPATGTCSARMVCTKWWWRMRWRESCSRSAIRMRPWRI